VSLSRLPLVGTAEWAGIDCPFRTAAGSCLHVDRACGRQVTSHVAPNGKTYKFGEDACLYCIKHWPDPATRHDSKPVADWIKHGLGTVATSKTQCVHRGAFVRSNEDPAKRHCGACGYYE
jgi:hypothetical protein